MYLVYILLGLLVIVVLAKLDKYMTVKYKWKETPKSLDLWVESLEGRRNIYKIAMVLCFVPCVNSAITFLGILVIAIFVGISISNSKFWGHDFWDKLF